MPFGNRPKGQPSSSKPTPLGNDSFPNDGKTTNEGSGCLPESYKHILTDIWMHSRQCAGASPRTSRHIATDVQAHHHECADTTLLQKPFSYSCDSELQILILADEIGSGWLSQGQKPRPIP